MQLYNKLRTPAGQKKLIVKTVALGRSLCIWRRRLIRREIGYQTSGYVFMDFVTIDDQHCQPCYFGLVVLRVDLPMSSPKATFDDR